MGVHFDSAESVIEAIRRGEMVVLVDDEDRENEGDLIIAAEHVTPEHINFMIKEGRGLVCLCLTEEKAAALGLYPMVSENSCPRRTQFTISMEAREGITTGISAFDRAKTIQTAMNPSASFEDFVHPGHMFPIIAKKGGVLVRGGHTEATVDLARLAGLKPAGVLVEILNEDGTMARRDDLAIFCQKHGLKMGTIADLIEYRLRTEAPQVCEE
jgi:3,4-dihydroxy 2-butanone 4-phosphate synthase/GTP cyclohydrolase II